MSKTVINFAVILFSFFFLQMAFAAPSTTTYIKVKGRLPQGVIIKKNTVTLKSGYEFQKTSDHSGNVVHRRRGGGLGTTGSFDCTCNGTSGGCDIITTPSSVSCAKSTCSSSCYMIVTIPTSGTVMH